MEMIMAAKATECAAAVEDMVTADKAVVPAVLQINR
jgi:hypothetical protein